MLPAKNSIELLHQINSEKLFIKLIEQLNKDLQLANITESFNLTVSILELKKGLSELLLKLISHKYDDYLNLLYRIDVPEKELATIKASSLDDSIEIICFLILKREFQKVWFKNRI
jgi:hypothetical protein